MNLIDRLKVLFTGKVPELPYNKETWHIFGRMDPLTFPGEQEEIQCMIPSMGGKVNLTTPHLADCPECRRIWDAMNRHSESILLTYSPDALEDYQKGRLKLWSRK